MRITGKTLEEKCVNTLEYYTDFKFVSIVKEGKVARDTNVKAICKNGHEITKNISTLIRIGCYICEGRIPQKFTDDEIYEILKSKGLWLLKSEGSTRKPATLMCRKCWHTYDVKVLHKVFKSLGCPSCSGSIRKQPHEIVEMCSKNGWTLNWIEYDPDLHIDSVMKGRCITCGTKSAGCYLYRYMRGEAVCANCKGRTNGFNPEQPAILYYLRIQHGYQLLYKIGITNRSVKERFYNFDLEKITVVSETRYEKGLDALNEEKRILNTFSEYRYKGEPVLSSGNTELFVKDVLELDS